MENFFNFGEENSNIDNDNFINNDNLINNDNFIDNDNLINNGNFTNNDNFINNDPVNRDRNCCNRVQNCCNRECTVCRRFASILRSNIFVDRNNLCVVGFNRNLNVEILGRRTRSPLSIGSRFSFENPDRNGRTLNLGEVVLLQQEVNNFVSVLRRNGIIVSSIQTRWLFDNPRLVYVNFESIDCPLDFARKVAQALRTIRL